MTITTEQIEALGIEAGAAGDSEQVELCRRALAGDMGARQACAEAIAAADAMRDTLAVGDRVEAGVGPDHDVGRIIALDGDRAEVAWQSGVRTWQPRAMLMLATDAD